MKLKLAIKDNTNHEMRHLEIQTLNIEKITGIAQHGIPLIVDDKFATRSLVGPDKPRRRYCVTFCYKLHQSNIGTTIGGVIIDSENLTGHRAASGPWLVKPNIILPHGVSFAKDSAPGRHFSLYPCNFSA